MKQNILIIIFMTLFITLFLGGIGFAIYVYATYSNVPLKDLPAWVLPFFIKGGR